MFWRPRTLHSVEFSLLHTHEKGFTIRHMSASIRRSVANCDSEPGIEKPSLRCTSTSGYTAIQGRAPDPCSCAKHLVRELFWKMTFGFADSDRLGHAVFFCYDKSHLPAPELNSRGLDSGNRFCLKFWLSPRSGPVTWSLSGAMVGKGFHSYLGFMVWLLG